MAAILYTQEALRLNVILLVPSLPYVFSSNVSIMLYRGLSLFLNTICHWATIELRLMFEFINALSLLGSRRLYFILILSTGFMIPGFTLACDAIECAFYLALPITTNL